MTWRTRGLCPVCYAILERAEGRTAGDSGFSQHLLDVHRPEDFGLSELGEVEP